MSIPTRQTGKERSQRIQIDYYKIRSGLDRWRMLCALLGLLLAGGYAAYVLAMLPRRGGGGHLSTGPISAAHASIENDCQACHLDFTPLDPHAPTQWLPLIGGDADAAREQMEEACQQCHLIGSHYRSQMHASFSAIDQTCARCHREHQGREHDLAKFDHRTCTQCHRDLTDVVNGEPSYKATIIGFNNDAHGDFESLRGEDPGELRFSHHQHMLPGQVAPGQKGGMTLAQLDDANRQRYRQPGQTDRDAVQLKCNSCHTLSGQDLIGDAGSTFSIDVTRLGTTMNPVTFQQHCEACHAISAASASGEAMPLPHAVAWSQVTSLLAATINGDRATGIASHRRDTQRDEPQLGTGTPPPTEEDWRVTDSELAAAVLRVRTQCLDCHESNAVTDEAINASKLRRNSRVIPRRWLQSGFYDHAIHRQIDCQYCHADAFPESALDDRFNLDFDDSDRVMIAGIESCEGCHRAAGSPPPDSLETDRAKWFGSMTTWASDQCTTCHRYHTPGDLSGSQAALIHQSETTP